MSKKRSGFHPIAFALTFCFHALFVSVAAVLLSLSYVLKLMSDLISATWTKYCEWRLKRV